MMEVLLSLPAHFRRRLIDALESGILRAPYSPAACRSALDLRDGAEEVAAALTRHASMGASGAACAAWMRAAESAIMNVPKPDLVWSGPDVPGVHARSTRQVYEELLGAAEQSIWISSYAYFDGPSAFAVLAQRMEAKPLLDVLLLLNIQRRRGDTSVPSDVVRRFADRFWGTDWPGTSRPQVYYDPRSLDLDGPASVLHAKAVVADEASVFITSANLTEAALDRNIELGLLVRDRALALSLLSHFRVLIGRGLLLPLPSR
jgi:phosphatidylserine/phosphatidylglycerophosphate/cardiolipin synthase-like enzyme